MKKSKEKSVWLVYDGECPICQPTANAIKIKKAVGVLYLVNAREPHPILEEIKQAGLNLDDGMVVKFQHTLYHGADAQYILAMIGTDSDWFNRMNVILFHSKFVARLIYPILRFFRNTILKIKGIKKLNNLAANNTEPIFKPVFGKKWDKLPKVLRKRYSNLLYSDDIITVKGNLDINFSKIMYLFLPFFRLFNVLVPYEGKGVPVKVNFKSMPDSSKLYFERTFYFPGKKPYKFYSYMQHIKNNTVVEFVCFRIGWRMKMSCQDDKVIMQHDGYVWNIFGKLVPIPLTFILGEIYAEEKSGSKNSFSMLMKITHPLFGKIFEYGGVFKLVEHK